MLRYLAYAVILPLSLCVGILLYVVCNVWLARRSPLFNLPGPPSPGWRGSHLHRLMNSSTSAEQTEKMVKLYGKNFRVQGAGAADQRLITVDPVAITHILNRISVYEKPWQSRRLISHLIGEGMLASEGNMHRRQRKVSNPAFSQQNLNAFMPIFFQKAEELRNRITGLIQDREKGTKIDVLHWISRTTFDIIGLTGFDYEFNAIQDETNEMYLAYKKMFDVTLNKGEDWKLLIGIFMPILWKIMPTETNIIVKNCKEVIQRTGERLVREKKKALEDEDESSKLGKDLLTLLLKSNMSDDIPDGQRISDQDIFNQISTFLFAGSDTSSLTLTWTLYLLSKHDDIQTRLRQELQGLRSKLSDSWIVVNEPPVLDAANCATFFSALDRAPLLDMVVRESLRFIPPIHSSLRTANQDDEIPVSEPIKMRDGSVQSSFKISKGQFIHVAMESFNLDRSVWGPSAWEFDPYRWMKLPEEVKKQPGLYPNIMSFSSGPRACIGLRFSIMEIKIIIYVLLTSFAFSEPDDVIKSNMVLVRPTVRGRGKEGNQCPIVIRPC
ncbi:hypothetical protein M422DRAFT_30124 [Sphaerobolus stellatus SS14]|uniref:Cytochrome P450 n=1 Tax=Sphaerobolus stellatus (strain SS14) TaxID=990650 RepID=A0A0C9VDZ5_SPHS4|nr:hypothetical protein M422DRAFT_30124 [Sphaerobolus stellatus SS14]